MFRLKPDKDSKLKAIDANEIAEVIKKSPSLKVKDTLKLKIQKSDKENPAGKYDSSGSDGTLYFIHKGINTQTAIAAAYIVVADYVLNQGSNAQKWRKHWRPNKRLLQRYIVENKSLFSKIKDPISNLNIDVLGLGVVIHAYTLYKNKSLKDPKVFKNSFLNFFEKVSEIDPSTTTDQKLRALQEKTQVIQEYNSLPEKGVSMNLDAYLPDALRVNVDLFKEVGDTTTKSGTRLPTILETLEYLDSKESEDGETRDKQILKLASTITESLTEKFMHEVLGKPTKEEKEAGLKKTEKNYKAKEFQKEQRFFLDKLAADFGEVQGNVIINDHEAKVQGDDPLPLAKNLKGNLKSMVRDLLAQTKSDDIKGLFDGFERKIKDGEVKSSAYDWYSAASDKLEDFRLLIKRAKELEPQPYSNDDLQELENEVMELLQPDPIPDPETPAITIGPPKGADRAVQKIKKYDQDISRLSDIVRFTIIVDNDLGNFEQVFQNFKKQIALQGGEIATRIENRYEEPLPVAYGDITFSIRYESGLIGEVQMTTPIMAAAKNRLHHDYEEYRNIESMAGQVSGFVGTFEKMKKQFDAGDEDAFDGLVSNFQKKAKAIYKDLVEGASDTHKKQMKSEYDKLVQPILDAAEQYENEEISALEVGNISSKKASQYPTIEDLYAAEQNQLRQLQGYVEARQSMGMPDFMQPFPFRTVKQGNKIVFQSDFQEYLTQKWDGDENELNGKSIEEYVEGVMLSRNYDTKKHGYPPSYNKQVQRAYQNKTSSLNKRASAPNGSGFFIVEGIPYSWEGFMTLPKFFTGNNPAGLFDYELQDFLRKASPISEDKFHKLVAELTMEKAQKREDMLELGEECLKVYREAKQSGEIKTASANRKVATQVLRNKLIRLAHTKPHLRKHILPLLK